MKKAKLERKILSTWTFNGIEFVPKTEEDRDVKINELEQLDRYVEIIHRSEDVRQHSTKNTLPKRNQANHNAKLLSQLKLLKIKNKLTSVKVELNYHFLEKKLGHTYKKRNR